MVHRMAIGVVCALGLAGCGPGSEGSTGSTGSTGEGSDGGTGVVTGEPTPTSSGGDTGFDDSARPRETPWTVVVDGLPFPAEISALTIGRKEFNGNFANRGDVEVYLDQDAPVIRVEMRIYDFSDEITWLGGDGDTGTVDRMRLWAFAGDGDPKRPSQMPPEADCTVGSWKDNCKLGVYYDGQTQPVRAGADLRVHLPRSYRGVLDVVTEDNLNESSYPRLGDVVVVVDGICGSGSVSLASGSAAVKLCRALTPTPTCPAEQVTICETFTDDMGANAAWSPLCPCAPALFGQLRVESRKPYGADITIDMPDTTWVNMFAANQSPDKPHACVPEIDNCAPGACTLTTGMYSASAEYNYPSPAAPAGGGYNVSAVSAGCNPVSFFASAEDWVDENSVPMSAEHGHVRVCTDCL